MKEEYVRFSEETFAGLNSRVPCVSRKADLWRGQLRLRLS